MLAVSMLLLCTVVTTETHSMGPPSCTCTNQYQVSESTTQVLAAVLGVMTSLFLVVLALVITGWVWTCWTMKKKNKRTKVHTKCQVYFVILY